MDEIGRAVISVGPLEDAVVDAWLAAICQQYGEVAEDEDGWDLFVLDLSDQLGSLGVDAAAAEAFFGYVGSAGGLGLLASIAAAGSSLPGIYRSALAESTGEEVAPVAAADEPAPGVDVAGDDQAVPTDSSGAEPAPDSDLTAWYAYLATSGGYWNGTAEHWPAIREWLAADSATVGFGELTEEFLASADELALPERIALFRRYGAVITAPARPADEQVARPAPFDPADAAEPAGVIGSTEAGDITELADRVDVIGSAAADGLMEPAEVENAAEPAEPAEPEGPIDLDEVLRALEEEERSEAEQPEAETDTPVALDDTVLDADLQQWVLEMQTELGLAVDGVLGPKTFDALIEYAGDEYQDA